MDSLHVVKKIPSAWKTMVLMGALAALKFAQERFGPMSMHPVGFPFVAQQTGSRGEMSVGTLIGLAAIWFQMRVQMFAR